MKSRLRSMEMMMALVACLSFMVVAGRWAFVAGPLMLAIVASWWIPQRYSTTPRQQRMMFTVVGLPFLALAFFHLTQGGVVGFQRIALLGAVYVLVGAVLELYRQPQEARPAVFHAGICTAMLVGGLTRGNPYYLYCVMLYALGLVALLRSPSSGMIGRQEQPPSRAPKAALVVALLLVGGLGSVFFQLWPKVTGKFYAAYVDQLVGKIRGEALLFGPSSSLSSIQDLAGSTEIAARVYGRPVDLRGQVMVSYLKGRWSGITARADRDLLRPQRGRFRIAEPPEGVAVWRIVPLKSVAGPLPVPPGAVELIAQTDELELDPFDGIVADNEGPYQVVAQGRPGVGFSQRRPEPDSTQWQVRYLQLPRELQSRLKVHADRIVGERQSTPDIANALETYLGENGRYQPDAEHPPVDPILHFLDGDLAGHCEYFATSMTLLLRARGIPARYIIGYRAAERNSWGGYLVVRDRDAHAWVEAYYDGEWHTFDPTPAAELEARHPDGYLTPGLEAIWDYLKSRVGGFWSWLTGLSAEGFGGALTLLGLALGTLVMLFLVVKFRHRLSSLFRGSTPLDPIHQLGVTAYAMMAKRGVQRAPEETTMELADRARRELGEPFADWLLEYAQLRFRGGEQDEVQRLGTALDQLRKHT